MCQELQRVWLLIFSFINSPHALRFQISWQGQKFSLTSWTENEPTYLVHCYIFISSNVIVFHVTEKVPMLEDGKDFCGQNKQEAGKWNLKIYIFTFNNYCVISSLLRTYLQLFFSSTFFRKTSIIFPYVTFPWKHWTYVLTDLRISDKCKSILVSSFIHVSVFILFLSDIVFFLHNVIGMWQWQMRVCLWIIFHAEFGSVFNTRFLYYT